MPLYNVALVAVTTVVISAADDVPTVVAAAIAAESIATADARKVIGSMYVSSRRPWPAAERTPFAYAAADAADAAAPTAATHAHQMLGSL